MAPAVFTNEIVSGLEKRRAHPRVRRERAPCTAEATAGGALTFDAGSVTYRISFDAADNVTAFEIVSVHGPHPAFQSDVWCEAAVEALGLS